MAIYKYRIEAKKVAPRQGSKLLGTATLNIAGQFKVTGIQIWQGKGGKPFVSMPSYKSNEVGANGKPVYKQLFHAIGADQKLVQNVFSSTEQKVIEEKGPSVYTEAQELLNKSVLKAYEKSSEIPGRPGHYETGRFDYSPDADLEAKLSAISKPEEKPLKITARMTAVPERNGMLGYGSIRVGDFQLNSVQYRASAENPANRYAAMPSYSVVKDGKPAYHNVGYPITTECSTAVREAVQNAYEYSLQHQNTQTAETNPFLEETEEQTKEVQKEQAGQETRKYELTGETKTVPYRAYRTTSSITLHRIRAVADFGDVKAGQLGGWIESEQNLSQDGNAFVYEESEVFWDARIDGNAQIRGKAKVYDNAHIYDNAQVSKNARVYGNAQIYGHAQVSGDAQVYYDAQIYGNAQVSGHAWIYDNAKISDEAQVSGNAQVYGDTVISGNTHVSEYNDKADAVSRRKEIRQELRANGFKANNALVSGIERLDAMTGKSNTLRDIKELAKDAHISAEAKETVNEVVENLQQQEAKMQAPEPPAPAMEPA